VRKKGLAFASTTFAAKMGFGAEGKGLLRLLRRDGTVQNAGVAVGTIPAKSLATTRGDSGAVVAARRSRDEASEQNYASREWDQVHRGVVGEAWGREVMRASGCQLQLKVSPLAASLTDWRASSL